MTPAIQNLLSANFYSLARQADLEIANAMVRAYGMAAAQGATPSEPDFVAMLVVQALPNFAHSLNSAFAAIGGSAQVTSVFCHGRPQVSHNSNVCEIGDVLIVFFHTDANGIEYRNSLLLQAKMSSKPQMTIGASDLHQLGLYTTWGAFTFSRTTGLSGQPRLVSPTTAHPGGQYLLIDGRTSLNPATGLSGVVGTYPMGTAISQRNLILRNSMGETILNMMMGSDGRRFLEQSAATSDWDQVIWDLIGHGFRTAFNQRRVGVSQNRGNSAIIKFALTQPSWITKGAKPHPGPVAQRILFSVENGQPPGLSNFDSDRDEEPDGLSVVIVESTEGDSSTPEN